MTHCTRSIIVQEGANATADYYFSDRLKTSECFSLSETPVVGANDKFELLFVRYFSPKWRHWCTANRKRIQSIRIFIDDDVFDMAAWRGLPWRYKFKLWNRCYRWKNWFQKTEASLLVSTAFLAQKYDDWRPELVAPKPLQRCTDEPVIVFYHGSASHKEDIQFVYGVMSYVLTKDSHIYFEIIGDSRLNTKFKALPRTTVIHPMRWNVYKQFNQRQYRHIGLAPLVDTPFNAARSCTKFYDICLAGAVGIYADRGPYSSVVQNNKNGVLVDMVQQQWCDAILDLANNSKRRALLLDGVKAAVTI